MGKVIVDFQGKSSRMYRYWLLASTTAPAIMAVGGNYLFAKQLPNGNWLPLYIGQAGDLKARLPAHERMAEARRAGANFVFAHSTPAGEKARLDEEWDLIQFWGPEMNTHHRPTG
jgi:hypothetical protein